MSKARVNRSQNYKRMSDPRAVAAGVVEAVVCQGLDIDAALQSNASSQMDPRDRALSQRLAYNSLRWLPALQFFAQQLLSKPINKKEQRIEFLLLVGLLQLWREDMPAHAVIHATVEATIKLQKPWAKGLMNACLRRFQREKNDLLLALQEQEARHALPADWLQELQHDWPNHWQEIAEASHASAPLWLRINQQQTNVDSYLNKLKAEAIAAEPGSATNSVHILQPRPVQNLPGFSEGLFAVQDIAAQWAVKALDLQAGQDVLDACAAPGGKTCHILEAEPKLASLTAIDRDASRVERIQDNLQRLGLQHAKVKVQCADAADPASWQAGQSYDRILLDAPCSASGVVRRHPDIPWRRRISSLAALKPLQAQLLEQMWPLLRPGGILVYVTCSIFASENQDQIQQFMLQHKDATAIPLPEWGVSRGVGRQCLPGMDGGDGFFYAALRRDTTD